MGFPRQEDWSGLPLPSPGDLPDPVIKSASPVSPALQEESSPTEPPRKPNSIFELFLHIVKPLLGGESYGMLPTSTQSPRAAGPEGCRCWLLFLVVQSLSCLSDSLRPRGQQHTRLPCPSLSPGVCSNSCPLSWWCHPTTSSSVATFSSCPQPLSASGSFPVTPIYLTTNPSEELAMSWSHLLYLRTCHSLAQVGTCGLRTGACPVSLCLAKQWSRPFPTSPNSVFKVWFSTRVHRSWAFSIKFIVWKLKSMNKI